METKTIIETYVIIYKLFTTKIILIISKKIFWSTKKFNNLCDFKNLWFVLMYSDTLKLY